METKKCAKCGRELPLDSFHKGTVSKDGRQSYCKECKRAVYQGKVAHEWENPLAPFTTKQLAAELKRRGCKGHIELVSTIEL